jgi:ABC-type amino acid transport substrate-binding protein
MKFSQVVMVILVSVSLSVYATRHYAGLSSAPAAKEQAMDRVLRTGVLRCGYYVFSPITIRDPNSGKLSGFSVDMMSRIAQEAGLKLEWTEQVDFGNWPEALKSGRFDAVCTPLWPDPSVARVASFTRPMLYSSISVYARGDDHRFDGNLAAVNDPKVTIVVLDGTGQAVLAETHFPKAKLLRLPQATAAGLQAENVATKKADLLLWDENGVFDYLKTNPNGLHNVDPKHPVRVMPFELAVAPGETRLREFLDIGVQSLEDTGYTQYLIRKWERAPGGFYPMAKPYDAP